MRKPFVVCGVALVAVLALAAPAAAEHRFTCESPEAGVTVRDVVVPPGAACSLVDATVTGDVKVSRDAFFEASGGTEIAGKVRADRAQTVFLDTDTTVGRSVKTDDTIQVFVFNATVGGDVEVEDTSDVVQVCGTTIERGDLEVERSGTDLLIGDPLAVDCAGNTVQDDVEIERNFTTDEFVVRGNTIGGDLEVNRNTGPVEKFVEDNTGGDELECERNEEPFTASGNTGWQDKDDQCEEVLTCEAELSGVTVDEVVVPADGACKLVDSTVTGDVLVANNAFFQASNTDIGGRVTGNQALTVFLDTGTTVGRSVKTRGAIQVFVFNAGVRGDVDVEDTSEVVQVCGTTIQHGDLEVERSGTDLLIGDPLAVDCAGNTVGGDVELERNFTDREFVVRGNTILGDLEVERNTGPVPKFVQDNVGGDELECEHNEEPFTASGNTGWREVEGQCAAPAV